jgi:di/tricarboxylate transporter
VAKALLLLFVCMCTIFLTVAVGVAVLIYGWGLSVQSWWWVIGGAVFQMAMLVVNSLLGSLVKD